MFSRLRLLSRFVDLPTTGAPSVMDVTRSEFNSKLPSILKNISDSHFLSFDLELSGIPDQSRRQGIGPKSLAERYKELKHAAETYHILQVGLSCVEEDQGNARYLIRSYNFNISPLVDDQLELERDFTYSTGAVDFLLRHGYQMESPFTAGIPYMTRTETKSAMERALARWDSRAIPDIAVRPDDAKALSFLNRVREEVDTWLATRSPNKDCLIITGLSTSQPLVKIGTIPLNRFEKRLVHQIVRAEYPSLQTSSRVEGVKIKPLDRVEQARIQKNLHCRLKGTISGQVGFRWVAEAMAGAKLTDLDLGTLGDTQIEIESKSPESFAGFIDSLSSPLRQHAKVLVGHNCLLDLVYFFKFFYGPLPETVAQFQQQVHNVFPLIIDTKYLSTNPGSTDALRFRNSQLWQVEQALGDLEAPLIADTEGHPSYQDSEQYHEAGFDSYVTAKVFLKLAFKIASEHSQTQTQASSTQQQPLQATKENLTTAQAKMNEGLKVQAPKASKQMSRTFFHPNIFSSLADSQEDDHESKDLRSSQSAYALSLLPRWDASFWTQFGNKIRVYGTIEELCELDDARAPTNTRSNVMVVATPKNKLEQAKPILSGLKDVIGKLL